jgi:hypothetical protein
MKLGLHAPVPHPINLELEAEPGAIDNHLERKVEVVKLDSARRRESREQAARHRAEVRRQRAHMDELTPVRRRWLVGLARDQVVRYHERLPGPEVARVVERNGSEGRNSLTLKKIVSGWFAAKTFDEANRQET